MKIIGIMVFAVLGTFLGLVAGFSAVTAYIAITPVETEYTGWCGATEMECEVMSNDYQTSARLTVGDNYGRQNVTEDDGVQVQLTANASVLQGGYKL